jgi:hypothetical protein
MVAGLRIPKPQPDAPDLLVHTLVVGWNDTSSSVTWVVDDNTNTYILVGTTAGHGLWQAIYYSRNMVLPNNVTPTMTVTFNQIAGFPDVRILEYSGLSTTAPLDNWAGSSGVSTSADSGGATTATSDLILGAGTTASTFTATGDRVHFAGLVSHWRALGTRVESGRRSQLQDSIQKLKTGEEVVAA